MLTQTSEIAVKVLIYVGMRSLEKAPVTPREIAESISTSPTYTAKVCGQLVKADILRSQRGAAGGVYLGHKPSELTLLEIVEACQGRVLPDYCDVVEDKRMLCAYHAAMSDLHGVVTGVLKAWTLQDLMARPRPAKSAAVEGHCLITKGWKSLQGYLDGTQSESDVPSSG